MFRNKRTRRLYARLHARVQNAKTPFQKARAKIALRRRFEPALRLSPPARLIASRAKKRLWELQHPDRRKAQLRRTYLRLKIKVVSHYSHGTMRCGVPGCNVYDLDLLHIDHVDADWSKDVYPSGVRMTGRNLYNKLIREGFPDGYQVLCRTHNIQKKDRASTNWHPIGTPTQEPGIPVGRLF